MDERVCAACGTPREESHRFCARCGAPVAPGVAAAGTGVPAGSRTAEVLPPPAYEPPTGASGSWAPTSAPTAAPGRRPGLRGWQVAVVLLCAAALSAGAAVAVHLVVGGGIASGAPTVDTSARPAGGPAVVGGPAPATPAAPQKAPQTSTRRVNLAPVDSSGRPVAGWTVRNGDTEVECGYPSPAAVSPGIQTCSPTAAAADVCWPAPGGRTVTCLLDPDSRELVRYPATGANVAVSPEADPSPVGLELADGTRCRLRNGGAWSGRADDPDLFGAYSCSADDDLIVWADDARTIDDSGPVWTVRVGTPTGPLRTLPITVATYAATA